MCLLATCSSISESSAFCHSAARAAGDEGPSTAAARSRWLGAGTLWPGSAGSGCAPRGHRPGAEGRVQILPSSLHSPDSPEPTLCPSGGLSEFQSLMHGQAGSTNHCMSGGEWRCYPVSQGSGKKRKLRKGKGKGELLGNIAGGSFL